jgi:hypothetical protein
MARANRGWRWSRILSLIMLALALFVAFEVGIRFIPPDAVQYRIQTINNDGSGTTRAGTITDPRVVARWDAALRLQPAKSLFDAYTSAWFGTGCSYGTIEIATARFTWHGLPVEVVSPGPSCAGGDSMLWSGGVPDPMTYQMDTGSLL